MNNLSGEQAQTANDIVTRLLGQHTRASAISAITPVTIGLSGAQVWRIVGADGTTHYVKLAMQAIQRQELRAERNTLAWLATFDTRIVTPISALIPHIIAYAEEARQSALLLSAIPGVMACDPACANDLPALARRLGEGLRLIHATPITHCPQDQRLDVKLAEAQRRVEAGLVDADDFDAGRQGRTADDLLREALATRPANENLVFTHGDYCLPNIFLSQAEPHAAQICGFVDWGRAGVADRYQDLGIATRSMEYNFGPGWEAPFWEAYGIADIDRAKVTYYRLLDEFF